MPDEIDVAWLVEQLISMSRQLDTIQYQITSRAWHPISETPPTGVTLIACDNRVGGGGLAAVAWDGEAFWSSENSEFQLGFFTHWQLADEPPDDNA